jgi:hypothetical protein
MLSAEPFGTVMLRPLRAAGVFLAHLGLGFVVMVGVWLTEKAFRYLWAPGHDPKFFDWCPVRWLFDAGEAGILVVFIIFGVYEAYRQLKG